MYQSLRIQPLRHESKSALCHRWWHKQANGQLQYRVVSTSTKIDIGGMSIKTRAPSVYWKVRELVGCVSIMARPSGHACLLLVLHSAPDSVWGRSKKTPVHPSDIKEQRFHKHCFRGERYWLRLYAKFSVLVHFSLESIYNFFQSLKDTMIKSL